MKPLARRIRGAGTLAALLLAAPLVGAAVARDWGPDSPVSDSDAPAPDPIQSTHVVGTVTGADGAPAARVQVHVEPLGGAPAVPDIAVITDESGAYRWTLPPGQYRLSPLAPGNVAQAVEVTVQPGVTRVDLQLQTE